MVAFAGQRGQVEETGGVGEPGALVGLGELLVELGGLGGVDLVAGSGVG